MLSRLRRDGAEKDANFPAGQVGAGDEMLSRWRRDGVETPVPLSFAGAADLPRACTAQAHTARAHGRGDGIGRPQDRRPRPGEHSSRLKG